MLDGLRCWGGRLLGLKNSSEGAKWIMNTYCRMSTFQRRCTDSARVVLMVWVYAAIKTWCKQHGTIGSALAVKGGREYMPVTHTNLRKLPGFTYHVRLNDVLLGGRNRDSVSYNRGRTAAGAAPWAALRWCTLSSPKLSTAMVRRVNTGSAFSSHSCQGAPVVPPVHSTC